MRPDKILFIDTETGGVNPQEHSLLSIAMVVWKENTIVDAVEVLINEQWGVSTPEALAINKIKLSEHYKMADLPHIAISKMDVFLNKHYSPNEKITLAGHNINFDINFIMRFLLNHSYNYNDRFSYRSIDTATILYYLYLAGRIKQRTLSSQEAFDLFGIKNIDRHTALGDARATANLFTVLLKIITKTVRSKENSDIKFKTLFDL
jgi:DNA polymerase-3 subunit epsilon